MQFAAVWQFHYIPASVRILSSSIDNSTSGICLYFVFPETGLIILMRLIKAWIKTGITTIFRLPLNSPSSWIPKQTSICRSQWPMRPIQWRKSPGPLNVSFHNRKVFRISIHRDRIYGKIFAGRKGFVADLDLLSDSINEAGFCLRIVSGKACIDRTFLR